jgi:hypothetical protein
MRKNLIYVLPPLIITGLLCIPDVFILVGIVQFIVGAIQLIIALIKTIVSLIKKQGMPEEIKIYWISVFVYILIGVFGGVIMNEVDINNDVALALSALYFSSAWGIAIYHLKHIMFLKL